MTDLHIHVAKDGTRTTHDVTSCPFIAAYGEYKGKRESVTGIMGRKTHRTPDMEDGDPTSAGRHR